MRRAVNTMAAVVAGAMLLGGASTATAKDVDSVGRSDPYAGYDSGRSYRETQRPVWREREPLRSPAEHLRHRDLDARHTADRLHVERGPRPAVIRTGQAPPRYWYSQPDEHARVIRNPRYELDRRNDPSDPLDRHTDGRLRVIDRATLGYDDDTDAIPRAYRNEIVGARTGYTSRDYAYDRYYRQHFDHDDNRHRVSVHYRSGYHKHRGHHGYYGGYRHYAPPYVVQRPIHRPYFHYRPYYCPPPVVYYDPCPPGYYRSGFYGGLSVHFDF